MDFQKDAGHNRALKGPIAGLRWTLSLCHSSRRLLALTIVACRFGRSPPQDVDVTVRHQAASAHPRRGSAGSFGDLPAAEQVQASASPVRNGRRLPVPSSAATQRQQQQQQQAPQQAPQLVRQGANGRLHNGLAAGQGDDDVLGTWAGRQRIFSEHLRGQEEQNQAERALHGGKQRQWQQEQQEQADRLQHQLAQPAVREGADEQGSSEAVVLRPPEPTRAAAAAHGLQPPQPANQSSDLDQEMNAAWRWGLGVRSEGNSAT